MKEDNKRKARFGSMVCVRALENERRVLVVVVWGDGMNSPCEKKRDGRHGRNFVPRQRGC